MSTTDRNPSPVPGEGDSPAASEVSPSTPLPSRERTTRLGASGERGSEKKALPPSPGDPAAEIDAIIAALGDWRGPTLARIRALIRAADPAVEEAIKWRKPTNPAGVPCWSHGGLICTGETYRDKIKLTFAKGAALPDPASLFNASLTAGTRRAINLREGDDVDEAAFEALIGAAVAANEG